MGGPKWFSENYKWFSDQIVRPPPPNPLNRIFSACQEAMDAQLRLEDEIKQARAELDLKQLRIQLLSHMIVEAEAAARIDPDLARQLQKAVGFEVSE